MLIVFSQRLQGVWRSHFLDDDEAAGGGPWAEDDCWPFAGDSTNATSVRIRRIILAGDERWVLLTGPQAQVRQNGTAVLLGISLLSDRDELVVTDDRSPDGRRFYFSTRALPQVQPAPAHLSAPCPRCKLQIEPGAPSVCCPRCHAWHHESTEFGCWSYADRCSVCHEQDTSLSSQLSWTPEEL